MPRLIDADALKNDILKSAVMIDDRGIQTGYEIAIELIKRQPTIDAEPVRHGKWIEVEDSTIRCRCSACGWESHLYEDDVYGMPYCPNCGTRMDEDDR